MTDEPINWKRPDGYEISTDRARVDRDLTHRFLSEESYWSPGVARDVVERAIDQSIVFGLYQHADGAQVGFARVVTDRATFAWLCDVFVLPEHRGNSLGKWLIECVIAHPELQGLRRLLLGTRDAQGLYAQYGFTPVAPDRLMERRAQPR